LITAKEGEISKSRGVNRLWWRMRRISSRQVVGECAAHGVQQRAHWLIIPQICIGDRARDPFRRIRVPVSVTCRVTGSVQLFVVAVPMIATIPGLPYEPRSAAMSDCWGRIAAARSGWTDRYG